MNMDRLSRIALVRVEEKAETILAENGWHGGSLRGIFLCGNGGMVREITHPTARYPRREQEAGWPCGQHRLGPALMALRRSERLRRIQGHQSDEVSSSP